MTTTAQLHSEPTGEVAPRQPERSLLLAAAVSGVLLFAAGLLTPPDGPPVETATAADIRTYLAHHVADLRLAALQGVLIVPLMLVFAAALARMVRNRLPGSMLADVVVMAGVSVSIPPVLAAAARSMTLVQVLDGTDLATINDATLRGWYALTNFTHFLSDLWMAPIAMLLASFSVAALRARLLPRWLSCVGLAIAISGTVGLIGVAVASEQLSAFWFGGLFGWMLWTLAVALSFALQWRRLARRPAPNREELRNGRSSTSKDR